MTLTIGTFHITLPPHWQPVEVEGVHHNVLVVDVRPETAHSGLEEIHPNLVLRHFPEEADGNVASAAFREAFLGGDPVVDGFLLLSYESFFTGHGLPARRHHLVAWDGSRLWHCLRWYMGTGTNVLELTLTVGEGDDLAALGEQCDHVARRVTVTDTATHPEGLIWPSVPADIRDPAPETVVTEQNLIPPQLENLQLGYEQFKAQHRGGTPWTSKLTEDQRRIVEQRGPALSGRGQRNGRNVRAEICLDTEGNAVVLVVEEAAENLPSTLRVASVPATVAVPLALEHLGVRTDWIRDVVFNADVGTDPGSPQWNAVSGGQAAADILQRPRDWWVWQDHESNVAAEWMQPTSAPPFAVVRGEDNAAAVPVMPGVLYAALQAALAEDPAV
ncbi:MAG: hypothetical protein Q4C81_09990 [Kocuria sp.]|nr:hypothetical protein [Kocuria sp.]